MLGGLESAQSPDRLDPAAASRATAIPPASRPTSTARSWNWWTSKAPWSMKTPRPNSPTARRGREAVKYVRRTRLV